MVYKDGEHTTRYRICFGNPKRGAGNLPRRSRVNINNEARQRISETKITSKRQSLPSDPSLNRAKILQKSKHIVDLIYLAVIAQHG